VDYQQATAVNVSMLTFFVSMLLYNNSYIDPYVVVTNLILIITSGFLLFIKIPARYSWVLIDIEFFVSITEIFFFHGDLSPLSNYAVALMALFLTVLYAISRTYEKVPEFSLIYGILFSFLMSAFARLGTDEEMIDYYSAHVFLEGLNPYLPENTASVYSHFPFFNPVCFGTPFTTGGVVTTLGYPSLSFLVQVPSNIIHSDPNYVNFFFYLLTFVSLYLILRKGESLEIYPYFLFPTLINLDYTLFPDGGIPDIIWVFFVILSLQSEKIFWKGLFYGVAISLKQVPLALLPFYLYYLRREGYSIVKFVFYSVFTFVIFNIYFIVKSPLSYFKDIISPETANLLQVSDGISQISVGNLFFLFKPFFDVSMFIIFLGEFYFFVKYYGKFKESWVGFPFFIFLFNYRSLWNYLMYWPFLFFALKSRSTKKMNIKSNVPLRTLAFLSVGIIFLAAAFHYPFLQYASSFEVQVLHVDQSKGYVQCLILNVSFSNNPYAQGKIVPLFRIFPYYGWKSINGIMWKSNASYLGPGQWEIVKLYPYFPTQKFEVQQFEVEAYYGQFQGYILVNPG